MLGNASPTSERAPYRVTLSQENATKLLVYWKDMQEAVGSKMRVGNTIRANVIVSNYHDVIQLRLRDPQNVQVVRILSTDPQHYLDERICPGAKISCASIQGLSANF